MAKTLAVVTPTYLSAATYGVIGAGRKELTPRLVTDFAALLGIDAYELAALTGIVLSEVPRLPSSEVVDAAALLWEVRRLSATQARHISDVGAHHAIFSCLKPDTILNHCFVGWFFRRGGVWATEPSSGRSSRRCARRPSEGHPRWRCSPG
ncbi:hypothetical protein ACQKM2_22245 [Streptomyces sp. NPDC004126]|uniref:hypothetical protein n=1 Tax=Streptomyces sp. NPDC004126 TaxID=3390695 RepID=UPI003D07331A